MKKQLLVSCCMLLLSGIAIGQTKQKPVAKPVVYQLQKLLTGINLPYKIVNDSLAAIPYEGDNILSYQVVIQKVSDLYIIFTNLSEALPDKLTEAQYKYLLQKNDHFDAVKIGLGEDGVFYLRSDLYITTATTPVLKRIITQVANVANIIAGDLK